eukprot:4945739-Ditylum_brightwellii.AAC.1
MTKAEYLRSAQAGKKKANHTLPQSTKPSNSNSSSSSNSTSNPTSASNSKLPKVHQKQMENKLPPRVLQKNLLENLPAL